MRNERSVMSKYEIGREPTTEEWNTYERVSDFLQRGAVANWLEYRGEEATPEQFEGMFWTYRMFVMCDDDHDWELLWMAWNEVEEG